MSTKKRMLRKLSENTRQETLDNKEWDKAWHIAVFNGAKFLPMIR